MRDSYERAAASNWLNQPILRRPKDAIADAAASGAASDPDKSRAVASRPSRNLCVLVADDNPVNLAIASEMLSNWGIKPLVAANGAEAVALAGELQLDIILMDLQMPVLDGIEATRQIRRLERKRARARIPIVAYTSAGPTPALLGGFGIDGLLMKPCDVESLRECLIRWCPATGSVSSS